MKKFLVFIFIVLIIAAGVIMGPKLIHTCDDCETVFLGTGYEPNIIAGAVSGEYEIICKSCAQTHHALSIAVGGNVEDYALPLFE